MMLKLPKGQKNIYIFKIKRFKSIEIKQQIYIYIYIYIYKITQQRNTIERRESMIIAFLLLKLARQLNVLQKMNLKIHM